MNHSASPRRGRSVVAILFLSTLFVLTLALVLGSARADGPGDNSDEVRAVLVGLRADRVAQGFTLQPASFAPDLVAGEARGLFRQKGVYHDPVLDAPVALEHVYRLELAPGAELENVIETLSQRADVAFVEPDYVAHQVTTPDDPLYDQQWGLEKINAADAWDVQTDGARIAIVDAGIDLDHPDLADRIWTNAGETPDNGIDEDGTGFADDMHGWNFYADNDDLSDSTGHGTEVAGIIGAAGNNGEGVSGVCWDCELMVLKVIQPGGTANYSDIAEAIAYAVLKEADVINLSLGGYSDSAALRAAVAEADEAVLVAGVGNDDDDAPFYPAAYESVLAVAGTDAGDARVHNSNYGEWVDLSAPGENVLTTFDGRTYGEADGTSLAAPFVSGAAALLVAEHGWSPAEVRAHLLQTAQPIDGANPGYEGQLGAGRLDAGAALNTAAEPDLVAQAVTVDGKSGGQPEPGATVDVQVTLTNNWAPVGALEGTLSSNDSYATIAQGSASFEPMGTYSTTQNSTPFQITVENDAPYGHELDLRLTLKEGGSTVQTIPVRVTVAQQTINVNGIIGSDTTWSGDRVYRLTGNVRVQEGATLTVEPGARVEADNDRILEVEGKLVATGTETAPIVFTSAEGEPTSWSWRGLDVSENGQTELGHCEVSYASTGVNIQSSFQMHTIDDCYIHHNGTGVQTGWDSNVNVEINRSRLLHNSTGVNGGSNFIIQDSEVAYNFEGIQGARQILRNKIHHNGHDEAGVTGGPAITLSSNYSDTLVYSNTIVMNAVGIALDWGSDFDIRGNNIDANETYNVRLNFENDVTLSGNWWGTIDLDAIHDSIYDWGEDSNLGMVDVEPILTTPSTAAPAYLYDVDVSPDTTIGLEEVTLDLRFSGAMDESLSPEVTFNLERLIDDDDIPDWTQTQVNDVAVTPNGDVWLATDGNGVIRFDGNQGTIYRE
ncbi:MAG: S8 family serine peptidase, partial [Chloroflexota bacterium]